MDKISRQTTHSDKTSSLPKINNQVEFKDLIYNLQPHTDKISNQWTYLRKTHSQLCHMDNRNNQLEQLDINNPQALLNSISNHL